MSQELLMRVPLSMDQMIAAKPAAAGLIKDTTTNDFYVDVLEASREVPILVDFWAPWCGPCKQLTPILEKAVKAANGAVKLVKLNIDEHPDIPGQLRIQSIPAVFAFRNGQPVDGFVGAQSESQVQAFIKRLAGKAANSPIDDALVQAKEVHAEGDVEGAASIYQQVLEHEPENGVALGGLARCLIELGDAEQAKVLLDSASATAAKHADVVSARTALDLALAGAAAAAGIHQLDARLQADPGDHEARFERATAAFAAGQRESAIDDLLHIVKADRGWNEEAARKQLVKLFEAMGSADPLTVSARKRLSRMLFA